MNSIETIVEIKYLNQPIRFKVQEKGAVMVNSEDLGKIASYNVDEFLNSPRGKIYTDALKKSNSILSDMSVQDNIYYKDSNNETYICSFLALKFIELKSDNFYLWLYGKIEDLAFDRATSYHYESAVISHELDKNCISLNKYVS